MHLILLCKNIQITQNRSTPDVVCKYLETTLCSSISMVKKIHAQSSKNQEMPKIDLGTPLHCAIQKKCPNAPFKTMIAKTHTYTAKKRLLFWEWANSTYTPLEFILFENKETWQKATVSSHSIPESFLSCTKKQAGQSRCIQQFFCSCQL